MLLVKGNRAMHQLWQPQAVLSLNYLLIYWFISYYGQFYLYTLIFISISYCVTVNWMFLDVNQKIVRISLSCLASLCFMLAHLVVGNIKLKTDQLCYCVVVYRVTLEYLLCWEYL